MGYWAPARTPKEIIQKLNGEINSILNQPDVRERIRTAGGNGLVVSPTTPEAYWQFTIDEQKFWAEAARIANYQPES